MSLKINNLLLLIIFLIHIVFPGDTIVSGSHHRQPPARRPAVARDPEVVECLDHCDNTEVSSYLACQRSCELELYPEEGSDEEAWEERSAGKSVSEKWRQPEPRSRRQITPQYEYGQCMQLCGDDDEQCEQLCEERLRAAQRKQDWDRERQLLLPSSSSFILNNYYYEEEEKEKECLKLCDRVPTGQQRQLCRFRCLKHNHHHHPTNNKAALKNLNHHHQQQLTDDENNPYYFHSSRFRGVFTSEEGHIRLLHNFADRSPQLFTSIQNYRLAILEANPNTFIIPHHSGAHYTGLFVAKGTNITIHLVKQDKKVSHKLEKGDVFRVPAGTTMYLSNAGSDQPIQLVKLIYPVNTPGSFQTQRDQLERVFGQQRQGVIVRAREEQLRALSLIADSEEEKEKGEEKQEGGSSEKKKKKKKKSEEEEEEKKEGGRSTKTATKGEGEEKTGPFNLLKQKPVYSNKFGQFFEASPDDNKQLKDLDISVAFAQLNQGTMFLPHYNSKTATLVFVTEGSGRFEMACPHLGGQREYEEEGGEISGQYQQAASHLSTGDVFIIPSGHPITIISSENENLHMVGFGINARNNQRNFLAGKKNIVDQIDTQAKELAFNIPSEEIDGVFSNQQGSYFVAARQQREKAGSNDEISVIKESILDVATN